MSPSVLNVEDASIWIHMRSNDVAVFALAAKIYQVFILVRRTNPASIPYIGRAGFAAKRIDCKAKTADNDVALNGRRSDVAGLVVNPKIVGPAAFAGSKYQKALEAWSQFESHLAPPTGAYVNEARPYGVQDDPSRPRFGAVVMYRYGQRSVNAQLFIHGDYDLFAIVPAGDRASNTFVEETLMGQPHARGKQLMDVQNWINARIGFPMVLHGEQDHYDDTFDDLVDIFFPDGVTIKTRSGATLQHFYREEFGGRALHKAGTPATPAGGRWVKG